MTRSFVDSSSSANALSKIKRAISTYRLHDNRLSRQSSSSQQQQQQLHHPYATDIGSKSLQTLDRHYNYNCQQSPETAKSGYLMVLDKRKGRSNMAWILRHCVILAKDSTLASTPGGTNSTRKPRPFLHLPACLFRMINGNKHTTGHGFSKRNIIEVVDKETNVPLVYFQARTKMETRAWLFNLRLYMAYGQQDNAACLLQNCCTDLLSLAPDDNDSGNWNAGHSSPPGEWRGINEGSNNPNSSTSSKAKSVGGGSSGDSVAAGAANEDMAPRNVGSSHASIDNDFRTSATHSHPLPIASSLSRLLDSSQQKYKHKHKPPSLVQAVADSGSLGHLAPVWLKPSERCTPCVLPLHIDRHHHHHHHHHHYHHHHASSNLYTCNQGKKQRKRHLMSSDSTAYTADTGIVSVITAGVVYLQTYLDDQPRPIPHYLHTKKKEGKDSLLSRWRPFIGVLAKCGASVGFFLLDPDDPAKTAPQQHVRMVAELDVQSLSAHDIQPLDDSLFDSSFAFSIRVHQNPASQFNDSMRACYSHSLAEHFDLEMLAKYCNPDDDYDSDNDEDDGSDSTSVFSRSTMGSRSSSSTDTGDSREGGDICFAVKDPADMPPSLESRLHTKEDVVREGTGEARWTFVEGKRRIFTDTSDRKERSKSLGDLGNFISPGDTDNDRHHNTKLETAALTEEEGHVKPHLELGNSNTHAIEYTRETTHPLPYILYMSTTRANERSSWIHHLRRFSRIAMLSRTINNSQLPQQQKQQQQHHQIAIDFRIERSLWIGVCEIRGLSQQEPGREAKLVPAVTAMLSLDGCPIASCSVLCVQQVNGMHRESPVHQFLFCSLPPIQEGVAIVLQSKEERENKKNDGDEEERLSTRMVSNIGGGLLGYCHIPVPFMQRESTYDGWYPISYGPVGAIDKRLDPYIALASNVKPACEQLCTAAGQKIHDPKQQQQVYDAVPSAPFRSGDVRVQVRYNELVVLAQPFYFDIIDHLFEANPTIVFDIAVGLPRSADWVVETMTKIALANNRFESWIEALVRHEVLSLSVRDPALIFRGASVTTRAMDTLMKVCGLSFLDQMIGDIVRAIVDSEHRCEVDPTKLSSGESLDNHWEMLTRLLQALWQAIEESKDWCPVKMRRVFYRIRQAVLGVYTDDVTTSEGDRSNSSGSGGGAGSGTAQGNVQYSCISGFLFLRLLCPAMLSPRAFGLVNRAPSTPSLRTLTLLAKGIQCTANLTDFSQKEPYMQPMNSIIQQSIPKMKSFIDYVASNDMLDQQTDSTAQTAAAAATADTGLVGSSEAVDGERELAALCVFLSGAREEIQEMVAVASAVYSRPPALATTQRPPFASDLRGGSVSGPTSPTTALDSAIDLSQLSGAAVSAESTTAPPSSPTSIKTVPLSVAADSNPSEVTDTGGNSNPLAIISPNGSNGNGGSRGLTHHLRPFRKVSDGQIPARRKASHAMMLDVAYQTSATSLPAMPKREAGKIHHHQQHQQQQQPAQPPWAAKPAETPVFKQSSIKGIEELLRLCQIVQNYSDICKRN